MGTLGILALFTAVVMFAGRFYLIGTVAMAIAIGTFLRRRATSQRSDDVVDSPYTLSVIPETAAQFEGHVLDSRFIVDHWDDMRTARDTAQPDAGDPSAQTSKLPAWAAPIWKEAAELSVEAIFTSREWTATHEQPANDIPVVGSARAMTPFKFLLASFADASINGALSHGVFYSVLKAVCFDVLLMPHHRWILRRAARG